MCPGKQSAGNSFQDNDNLWKSKLFPGNVQFLGSASCCGGAGGCGCVVGCLAKFLFNLVDGVINS